MIVPVTRFAPAGAGAAAAAVVSVAGGIPPTIGWSGGRFHFFAGGVAAFPASFASAVGVFWPQPRLAAAIMSSRIVFLTDSPLWSLNAFAPCMIDGVSI